MLSVLLAFLFAQGLPSSREVASEAGDEPSAEDRTWSLPLVALGVLAACAPISEGAVADWVGVYLKETVHSPQRVEALGFAAFSLTMLVGRLFGDRLSQTWGPVRVAQLGSAMAAAGLVLALGLPFIVPAICGFALIRLGMLVLAP